MGESKTSASNEAERYKVSGEKFSAELDTSQGEPIVRFTGTVSTANPAAILNPFIDDVHDAVARAGSKIVTVDFNAFEFCNSSGFKSFIYWIERVRELPEENQYRLRFLVAPGRRWQRTSLLVLTCFATDAVEIAA